MENIMEVFPFGVIVIQKEKVSFINKKAMEILGLAMKGDPISIGIIKGRMGVSIEEEKDSFRTKIFEKNFQVKKLIFKEKIMILLIFPEEKEEEERLAYLSHELRAPLSSVSGALQALMDGLAGEINEKQKNFLAIALKNCQKIKEIIEEVFDYKAIEKETDKIEFKAFSLKNFIDEIVDSFKVLDIKNKALSIIKNYPENIDDFLGYGDKRKLTQVLTNILINAFQHSRENSKIELNFDFLMKEKNNFIKISVTNEGKELSMDLKEKIFSPWYHFGRDKGLGLGLPISKKIIEKHEGEIDYYSGDGKTTFYFTFPVIKNLKIKILFVEDDLDLQEIVRVYLEKSGYDVMVASSGNKAIEILEKFNPDLIITDLMMSDGTGWELIKFLNKMEKKPKIIVLSGMKSILDHSIALDILKVDSFLDKPFDPKKLLIEIEKIAGRR